jgi:hypothetical protein
MACHYCGSELIEKIEPSTQNPSLNVQNLQKTSFHSLPRNALRQEFSQFFQENTRFNTKLESFHSKISLFLLKSSEQDCSICQEKVEKGIKLFCGHSFHSPCIKKWLQIKNSCPSCRTSV